MWLKLLKQWGLIMSNLIEQALAEQQRLKVEGIKLLKQKTDKEIINYFLKYRQRVKPFKELIIESAPCKGYYLDNDFFKHDEIIEQFKKAIQDLENVRGK